MWASRRRKQKTVRSLKSCLTTTFRRTAINLIRMISLTNLLRSADTISMLDLSPMPNNQNSVNPAGQLRMPPRWTECCATDLNMSYLSMLGSKRRRKKKPAWRNEHRQFRRTMERIGLPTVVAAVSQRVAVTVVELRRGPETVDPTRRSPLAT